MFLFFLIKLKFHKKYMDNNVNEYIFNNIFNILHVKKIIN